MKKFTFLDTVLNIYLRSMNRISIWTIALVFLSLLSYSCKKQKEYPIEPIIEMSSRQIYKSPSKIIISFTDGDGDIGLDQGDTIAPYNYVEDPFNKFYYNLLLYYFEKQGDEWVEVETAIDYFYRVPNITPSGQNKALNGEIEVDLTLPLNRPDSIRYNIELIDRALHESNIITTPVIYK